MRAPEEDAGSCSPTVDASRQCRPSRGDHRGSAVALVLLVAIAAIVRFWDLGAARLNYDESFTAMAGRLPVGSLFGYLRLHDSHPPLDYLLRAPLARAGVSEFWFRAPSADPFARAQSRCSRGGCGTRAGSG